MKKVKSLEEIRKKWETFIAKGRLDLVETILKQEIACASMRLMQIRQEREARPKRSSDDMMLREERDLRESIMGLTSALVNYRS